MSAIATPPQPTAGTTDAGVAVAALAVAADAGAADAGAADAGAADAGAADAGVSVAAEALWRLAYVVSGDRALARAIVTEVLRDAGAGLLAPGRVRGEVLVRARARTAHGRVAGRAAGDRLWTALRHLPRRRRAEIVQRLH